MLIVVVLLLGSSVQGLSRVSDQSRTIGRLRKDTTPVLKVNTPKFLYSPLVQQSVC